MKSYTSLTQAQLDALNNPQRASQVIDPPPPYEVGVHYARADQLDDGSWEGCVLHINENDPVRLRQMFGDNPPNPKLIDPVAHPMIHTTTLRIKHATPELALKHAQIHADALNAVKDLLTNG